MSMLDSFFSRRFNGAKCKTLLKLTIPRIKLLRNRREIQIKQMRKDIAKLLETGQEATARIRVEHIIREENMMAAQEIIELFCELIAVRLPIIETQRECPLDLKEAISSVCFAAPRCADLPELLHVQMLFASKYGKEFVAAATELMPDCGVNRQLIELLSVRAPPPETKLKLLKEIAEEHDLDWDPAGAETEFFKPHEDLLNGPTQFIGGSKLPLPKEKNDEPSHSDPIEASNDEDSDSGLDSLDLPEVPRVSLRPIPDVGSAPELAPPPSSASPPGLYQEHETFSGNVEMGPESVVPEASQGLVDTTVSKREDKQFLPFISSPSLSSTASFSVKENVPTPVFSRAKSEAGADGNVDLQDVLAAAQAAAETAERAAAAARSAASLAQVRITELVKKKGVSATQSNEPEFNTKNLDQSATTKTQIDSQPSFGSVDSDPSGHGSIPSQNSPIVGMESSPPSNDQISDHSSTNPKFQKSISIDDDPYFSYPNLFTSRDSNLGASIHSSSLNNSPSSHDLSK